MLDFCLTRLKMDLIPDRELKALTMHNAWYFQYTYSKVSIIRPGRSRLLEFETKIAEVI